MDRLRSVFGPPDDDRCAPPADRGPRDSGRAILEVIFGAVLLLIPTVYILITVFKFQAATFAVTQAARDVGRVISITFPSGTLSQAQQVAEVALADQQLSARTVVIRFTEPGASCDAGSTTLPPLRAGSRFDVCVTTVVDLPGVPSVIGGSRNTVTGVYSLAINEFVEGAQG